MQLLPALLASIVCGKCKTSLTERFERDDITKYKCQCGEKIRALQICNNCKKYFLNFPYLIRKTNYCSSECYRLATDRRQIRNCKICYKQFYVKAPLIKKGFGFYCSRDCWFSIYKDWKKLIQCKQCKKKFLVHRSVFKRKPKFCSKICKDDFERDYIERTCRGCKKRFMLPRSDFNRGRGSFCTWQCFKKFNGETSIERIVRLQLQKLKEPFKQEAKFGKYHTDFFLPKKNLIIECDGEYWHRNKEKHDQERDIFLQNLGYKVLRFQEEDIKTQQPKFLQAILRFAQSVQT